MTCGVRPLWGRVICNRAPGVSSSRPASEAGAGLLNPRLTHWQPFGLRRRDCSSNHWPHRSLAFRRRRDQQEGGAGFFQLLFLVGILGRVILENLAGLNLTASLSE